MKKNLLITLMALMLQVTYIFSQSNHATNVSSSATHHFEPLGWITGSGSVSNDLDIDNNFSNQNINLSTFNGSLIKRMTILNTGEVGVGNFAPIYKLDVDAGDINLNTFTNAYRIGDGAGGHSYPVLWHNGDITSIFVGVGAGNSGISANGNNTLVGNNSGNSLTSGKDNTSIGFEALKSNHDADNNVAIGNNALHNLVTWTNDGGGNESENTAVGVDALHDNVAYGGCALGYQAGQYNTTGCSLIAIGEQAAQSSLHGNNNMAIGEVALRHNSYLSENVALGKWALEWMSFNPGSSDACVNSNGYTVHGCVNSFNVAVGNGALRYTNPGSVTSGVLNNGKNNTAIGDHAGANNITGYDLSILGYLADVCPTCSLGVHNSTAIGANAIVNNSNEMILGDNSEYVGIGYSGSSTYPPGYLSVNKDNPHGVTSQTIAGYFHNGDVQSSGSGFEKIGVRGICNGQAPDGSTNIGGDFAAQNAVLVNYGLRGRTGIYTLGSGDSYGLYAFGGYFMALSSSIQNIGVYGYSDARGSTLNYGVYGDIAGNSCADGPPSGCVAAAGFFNGDVYSVTGNYYSGSDAAIKDNIQPLTNSIDIIKLLNPKSYTYYSQNPKMHLPNGTHEGLIAQEVQSVLPNLVGRFRMPAIADSNGIIDTSGTNATYLAVNYSGLIPYLIGAIKEQQTKIDSLKSGLDSLKSQVNNCCGIGNNLRIGNNNSNSNGSTIDVNLNDITTLVLDQNSPNPFSEETYINYVIPKEVSKAIIIIYDNDGQVLKTVTISNRGEGSVHVYAEGLSSGIYSYSLIADGKTIDTKHMVCQK